MIVLIEQDCNDWKFSSNVNEVIRAVLNFLLFFYKKISHAPKAQKAPKVPKAQKRNQAKAQKCKYK